MAGNSSAFTAPANAAAVELLGRGTTEPDPAKRKQIYSDLNDMLLQEAYIITMSPEVTRLMATTKVQGISLHPPLGPEVVGDLAGLTRRMASVRVDHTEAMLRRTVRLAAAD